MDTITTQKGIWYDKARDRYRVRVYGGGVLLVQGYFSTYMEAKVGLVEAKREAALCQETEVEILNRFLLSPRC